MDWTKNRPFLWNSKNLKNYEYKLILRELFICIMRSIDVTKSVSDSSNKYKDIIYFVKDKNYSLRYFLQNENIIYFLLQCLKKIKKNNIDNSLVIFSKFLLKSRSELILNKSLKLNFYILKLLHAIYIILFSLFQPIIEALTYIFCLIFLIYNLGEILFDSNGYNSIFYFLFEDSLFSDHPWIDFLQIFLPIINYFISFISQRAPYYFVYIADRFLYFIFNGID